MRPELGRTQYLDYRKWLVERPFVYYQDILFWSGGLDFECERFAAGVAQAEDLGDFLRERT